MRVIPAKTGRPRHPRIALRASVRRRLPASLLPWLHPAPTEYAARASARCPRTSVSLTTSIVTCLPSGTRISSPGHAPVERGGLHDLPGRDFEPHRRDANRVVRCRRLCQQRQHPAQRQQCPPAPPRPEVENLCVSRMLFQPGCLFSIPGFSDSRRPRRIRPSSLHAGMFFRKPARSQDSSSGLRILHSPPALS